MRRIVSLGLSLVVAGCGTSGDFRRISFSSDMTSSDLAHYRTQAARFGGNRAQLEDYSTGLPFWPVVWKVREGWSAPDEQSRYQYHFEDDWGLLLWAVTTSGTANFDHLGQNTGWSEGQGLLLNAISNQSGEAMVDGARVPTSSFRLLWGLFEIRKNARGSSWRLFWIPFGG
jgi:hypothetical protein